MAKAHPHHKKIIHHHNENAIAFSFIFFFGAHPSLAYIKRNPNAESICSGLEYIKNSSYGHKKGQAIYIAPLQPNTLASVKTWGILRELAV